MGRPRRLDPPGGWHHLINRGAARRMLCENATDFHEFLRRVEKIALEGLVEIHAGVVMGNHFHFLVRSVQGLLSKAIQRILGPYAQCFNRTRERDGPIYRSRFKAIPVRSYAHRRRLIGYIDWNPVCAGLAPRPSQYAYGTARHYVHSAGPKWLTRQWVEQEVCLEAGIGLFSPAAYTRTLGGRPSPRQMRLLERRQNDCGGVDDLDELLQASAGRVLEWLRQQSEGSGAWKAGPCLVDEETIEEAIAQSTAASDDPSLARDLLSGLHASLARLAPIRIARRRSCTQAVVYGELGRHARRIRLDRAYADAAVEVATTAIRLCHLTD